MRVLLVFGVVLIATSSIISIASAVPSCWQLQCVEPCGRPGHSCTATLYVINCDGQTAQFRCEWTCGAYSSWDWCNCDTVQDPGCFLEGTPVLLADGTSKNIEQVGIGDRVAAFATDSRKAVAADVLTVHPPRAVDYYFVINKTLRVSPTQPLLSSGSWIEVRNLRVGDSLTGATGGAIRIDSIERVDRKVTVYNLQIDSFETYVAGGVVAHNKPPWLIEPCPGCGPE
jgi:hypothetical protein